MVEDTRSRTERRCLHILTKGEVRLVNGALYTLILLHGGNLVAIYNTCLVLVNFEWSRSMH